MKTLPRVGCGLAVMVLATGCATGRSGTGASSEVPTAPKNTYVIVHGAWGGGWAFREVDRLMTADGNKVYRPTLTGQGERVHLASPEITLDTHIQDVVNTILYEDLHDVVLVGHSYGGMVITGVADRIPERIKHVVYVDAAVPENGENIEKAMARRDRPGTRAATRPQRERKDGFIIPTWVKPGTAPPHDVPQSAKTFDEPIVLKNQQVARAIPTTYILTVDPGKKAEDDGFYPSYVRAKARGWTTEVMEGDHNVQWSHPKELARRLEAAPGQVNSWPAPAGAAEGEGK